MQLLNIIGSLRHWSRRARNTDGIANVPRVCSGFPSHAKASVTRRLVRRVLPRPMRHTLAGWVSDRRVMNSPDRVYLKRVILPQIAQRGGVALLVGCRRYTLQDPVFLRKRGTACWTLDIDPAVARWGAKDHHIVAPIEQAASFFALLCSIRGAERRFWLRCAWD